GSQPSDLEQQISMAEHKLKANQEQAALLSSQISASDTVNWFFQKGASLSGSTLTGMGVAMGLAMVSGPVGIAIVAGIFACTLIGLALNKAFSSKTNNKLRQNETEAKELKKIVGNITDVDASGSVLMDGTSNFPNAKSHLSSPQR
ncbi:MAG: hypothetical protein AAF153_00435, partial [Pseudomonadota bacterium]